MKSNENIPPISLISRGYFAFPPGWDQYKENLLVTGGHDMPSAAHPQPQGDTKQDDAWDEPMTEERCKQLKIEDEIATQGEWEWVKYVCSSIPVCYTLSNSSLFRSGGVLRDIQGRRDRARTERIRAEICLQMEEQLLLNQWKTYEQGWRTLFASDGSLTFHDIPWPLESAPSDVAQLTPAAISKFIFATLRVRRNKVTQRERIRASLLRWHPDKLAAVLPRVIESDQEAVLEGVGAVFRCLNKLQQEK